MKKTIQSRTKRIWIGLFTLMAVVILIPLSAPYHVRIIDALSLQKVPGYGVHIPFYRILFEPFLGLLLYFNRSLYALTEVPLAMGWLFAAYLVWMVWRGLAMKDRLYRKRWFGGRIADIPIAGGLLLTLFVVMIFIRLPGNTIVNNTSDDVLVTTHCHTEWSHDGLISQKALWRWQKHNGFDAFFITDHNNHDKTLAFIRSQRAGDFPAVPLVMCGEEFSDSNHLSLLGLKKNFSTKDFPDSVAVNTTHAQGGAVIVNHWFDGENMTLEYYKNLGVDGFEIENTATDRYYPRDIYWKIRNFCEKNHLIMNGGLDFHGYGNVCSLWNAFAIPGWHRMDPDAKEKAILAILRAKDQSRLRVLMYHDRPYYDKKNLALRPPVTLFNYFRTLNGWQILSWLFWLAVFGIIAKRFAKKNEKEKIIVTGKSAAVKGVVASLFLLVLALRFYLLIGKTAGFNTIYPEYASLFLTLGLPLLVYSTGVAYIRLFKYKK